MPRCPHGGIHTHWLCDWWEGCAHKRSKEVLKLLLLISALMDQSLFWRLLSSGTCIHILSPLIVHFRTVGALEPIPAITEQRRGTETQTSTLTFTPMNDIELSVYLINMPWTGGGRQSIKRDRIQTQGEHANSFLPESADLRHRTLDILAVRGWC